MDERRAGTGYLALPDSGEGPGILVLHSWWGLNPFFRGVCDRLSLEGFVALAPDLFVGQTATSEHEAESLLKHADMDETAHLVRQSLLTLRGLESTPDRPVGTLGFSMGASWALWLAARLPDLIDATAVFYGSQSIDMASSRSAYLGHFAEHDPFVEDDEVTLLEAELRLLEKDVAFHRSPGTGHWFFESDRDAYDAAAAELAWQRTLAFFRSHLDGG
jgi:carboxymethylenebutenolidase